MKNVFIIRGLPGSGKSDLAHAIADEVFEADQFFVKDDEYSFDGSLLRKAHDECFVRFCDALDRGVQNIAVANTFTKQKDFRRYKNAAQEYGYRIHILIKENYHGGVSAHGVLEATMKKYEKEFEISLR
jgi:predicted kinase